MSVLHYLDMVFIILLFSFLLYLFFNFLYSKLDGRNGVFQYTKYITSYIIEVSTFVIVDGRIIKKWIDECEEKFVSDIIKKRKKEAKLVYNYYKNAYIKR